VHTYAGITGNCLLESTGSNFVRIKNKLETKIETKNHSTSIHRVLSVDWGSFNWFKPLGGNRCQP